MPRYRSKPFEIVAVQFDPANRPWPRPVYERTQGGVATYYVHNEQFMGASLPLQPGDFVVLEHTNHMVPYPMAQEMFDNLYDLITEGETTDAKTTE